MHTAPRTPVAFIHGIWWQGTSWHAGQPLFGNASHAPDASGWAGAAQCIAAVCGGWQREKELT